MKQLLTNLWLIVFFTGLVLMASARSKSKISMLCNSKTNDPQAEQIVLPQQAAPEIVQLDIPGFRFN